MKRSMMQVYVKGSADAIEIYKKAFDAELLCAYPDGKGGYMHSELNAYGQIIAVSERGCAQVIGNTMQFCFHMGEGGEDKVARAYDVLKDGATIDYQLGQIDYSSLMFSLTDKFGVYWCVFV